MLSGMSVKRAVTAGGVDTLKVTAHTSSDQDFNSPYFSQCGHRIQINGELRRLNSSGSWILSGTDEWIDGFTSSTAGDYECNMSTPSGTGTGTEIGTFGSWLSCDTERSWTVSKSVVGTYFKTSTLQVREKANTSNVVSALQTFSLENSSV